MFMPYATAVRPDASAPSGESSVAEAEVLAHQPHILHHGILRPKAQASHLSDISIYEGMQRGKNCIAMNAMKSRELWHLCAHFHLTS